MLKGRLDILNKLIINFKEVLIFNLKEYLNNQYGIFENNYNKNINEKTFSSPERISSTYFMWK